MFDLTKYLRRAGLGSAIGLVGLLAAVQAHAACLDRIEQVAPHARTHPGAFIQAAYRAADAGGAVLLQVAEPAEDPSIVGVWKFQLGGFLKDFGTQAFHAGGTETMFSAGVDPATGDVCQGVWRKTGHSTYTLNHIAMAWTAPGAEYGVLIHIHMVLRLAPSGNAFTGSYTVSLNSATPSDPFDESAGAFASGSGNVTATRLLPD